MDDSALLDLGLSRGEVRIFLTLNRLGESKVGPIIDKTGLASSAVHNGLNTLIEKGLVTYIKKGNIKHYRSIRPRLLLEYIESKKEKIQKIIPILNLEYNQNKRENDAEIYEGYKGIISMLNNLIADLKPKDEYLFFSLDIETDNEEIQKFFKRYDAKRKAKKLVVKALSSPLLKEQYTSRKHISVKFTTRPMPQGIAICKSKVAMFSWDDTPTGFLITSSQVSEMYRTLFNRIWNKL
jgi:sugar-specific transcriptional regulator TrmB